MVGQAVETLSLIEPVIQISRLPSNGMVERFNGWISEILATHLNCTEDLVSTFHRDDWLYNHHLPQRALGHIPPIEALKKWYAEKPDLFVRKPLNRPGPEPSIC